jgi:membrane protease YdiL (CAAX protease family)
MLQRVLNDIFRAPTSLLTLLTGHTEHSRCQRKASFLSIASLRSLFITTNRASTRASKPVLNSLLEEMTVLVELSEKYATRSDRSRELMQDTSKNATRLYLKVTFALSLVVWTVIIWSGRMDMGFGLMIPAIMWCPAVAAVITCRLLGRKVQSLSWRWPRKEYLAAAYLLPIVYASIAYGVVWAGHLGGWNSEFVDTVSRGFALRGLPAWSTFTLFLISMASGGVILNLSMTLGEEIGWRGFLVPELAKDMSFTRVSLVSGIVWAAWHSPLLLFADYNVGTNRWYELACSSVTCISVSFILAWLRFKSDSIWPAALLHASHNLFVPGIFDNLVRDTGSTLWYTTEFGAALAISCSMFAIYCWTRRAEIDNATIENTSAQPAVS